MAEEAPGRGNPTERAASEAGAAPPLTQAQALQRARVQVWLDDLGAVRQAAHEAAGKLVALQQNPGEDVSVCADEFMAAACAFLEAFHDRLDEAELIVSNVPPATEQAVQDRVQEYWADALLLQAALAGDAPQA